jgi:excisionase family DNA binding protein
MTIERNLRIDEVCAITGYKASTVRKKISRREIGYHKVGRIIVIPLTEVERLLGSYNSPITLPD